MRNYVTNEMLKEQSKCGYYGRKLVYGNKMVFIDWDFRTTNNLSYNPKTDLDINSDTEIYIFHSYVTPAVIDGNFKTFLLRVSNKTKNIYNYIAIYLHNDRCYGNLEYNVSKILSEVNDRIMYELKYEIINHYSSKNIIFNDISMKVYTVLSFNTERKSLFFHQFNSIYDNKEITDIFGKNDINNNVLYGKQYFRLSNYHTTYHIFINYNTYEINNQPAFSYLRKNHRVCIFMDKLPLASDNMKFIEFIIKCRNKCRRKPIIYIPYYARGIVHELKQIMHRKSRNKIIITRHDVNFIYNRNKRLGIKISMGNMKDSICVSAYIENT